MALLRTRLADRLSEEERAGFASAPQLISTKLNVELVNRNRLAYRTPKRPFHPPARYRELPDDEVAAVARIDAEHSGAAAASTVGSDKAGGLVNRLYLKNGARVMLKINMNVPIGLVNGAMGTVYDIVYDQDHRPPDVPFAVLVQFDHLVGSGLSCVDDADGVIPVAKHRTRYTTDRTDCSRAQIPLALAWAITTHK